MVTETSDAALYEAFKSRDARFDGRFFVGVSSTGIYCRPACHAKMPKRENCTFYSSAAEAELAGYRPCLTCRPELAPGRAIVDARSSLARRAAQLLEESCSSRMGMEVLAGKLGCTSRHLRRVFEEEHSVTPKQYVQTCRLLLAKSLLTDTRLPIAMVAEASGFGSARAFNEAFKAHYHMPPSRLRKQVRDGGAADGDKDVALYLGYQPPYGWDGLLAELAARAVPGVDGVEDGHYFRTVRLQGTGDVKQGCDRDQMAGRTQKGHDNPSGPCYTGRIEITDVPAKARLRLSVEPSLLPVLPQVMARVRRMFDTACDPLAVAAVLEQHALPGAPYAAGTRLLGDFDACGSGTDGSAAWPDAPCEDEPALIAALPEATQAERLQATLAWSPWRSYYAASLRQQALLQESDEGND